MKGRYYLQSVSVKYNGLVESVVIKQWWNKTLTVTILLNQKSLFVEHHLGKQQTNTLKKKKYYGSTWLEMPSNWMWY